MLESLLDPLFLFFLVGFIGGVLRSELKLPEAIYHLLSTYLLLSIGLKGGVQLAKASPGEVALPALAALGLGVVMAIAVFLLFAKIGRVARADAAAFAAHYGSTSAVTFAAVLAMLARDNTPHEGFLSVLLVIMEIPAILIAIFLHRWGAQSQGASYGTVIHEVMLNRSVFLLLAGMLIGLAAGPGRFEPFEVLFVTAFKPILAFFVLEMGLLAAQRIPDLRKSGVFVAGAAMIVPLVGGAMGGWAGILAGLSPGGATVLATLTASASYIAAPAAVRVAIPEANTGLCVAAALGVTFPFNLALGIPLYGWWANWLAARG
ncbi:MAG: sodium-dependent bicarbonate transport family permease [Opitutaceae bacterium]|nr:sodium-dependent bicarbonate transport family permease [Opitutaceae bacterium]